jgi:hypothetical protein
LKQLPELVVVDSVIKGNQAALFTGGALNIYGGMATIVNCTMHGNAVRACRQLC